MIGSICLWNFSPDRKVAEVGYDLHPKFQKRGIMDESLRSVLKFGFEKLGLDEIEAFTHRDNAHSITLLERSQFSYIKARKDKDNENNIIYALKKQQHISAQLSTAKD